MSYTIDTAVITEQAVTHFIMFFKSIACSCFLGIAVAAMAETSTLEIYPMPTQNGTIARRVFTDELKRQIQVTYYFPKDYSKTPMDESGLVPHETQAYRYDEQGRKIWMGVHSPEMTLRRSVEYIHDPAGQLQTTIGRDGDGVIRHRTLYENGRQISILQYDVTGKHLISIRGKQPPDIDLVAGWGIEVDGLVIGLAAQRTKGELKNLNFEVTVRNLTALPRKIVTSLPYHEIEVELRDASGHLVQQDSDYIAHRDKELRRMNHGINENSQTVPPEECQIYNGGYQLNEWYRSLPAGNYTLAVRRRTDGAGFTLRSNPVTLEIITGI